MATVRVQLRRGTEQQWYDANPVLAAGEVGIETDTNTFKFGDGTTAWRVLDYALSDTVDDYIPLSTKAVANGVASLDSNGFVPTSQLPPLAKVTVSAVANTAARLALTAEAGDIAIEADSGQSYVLSASPASTDANWKALVGSEAVVDLANAALVASTGLSKTYDDGAGTITFSATSAIETAAADATSKVAAEAALRVSGDAASVSTASADATSKANAAQAAAISAATSAIATAKSEAIIAAETYTDAFVGAAPGALNSLAELATALSADASFSTTMTNSLALKSPLASPTFTGAVTLPSTTSIGDVSNVEIGYLTSVTSDIQGQFNLKAPLASPTFTGTVTFPESTSIGDVSNLEIGYLNGVTSTLQGQIDAKLASATAATTYAPLSSPTITGTVTLPESTSIGNVSNLEIGYLNNVTSSIQGQIDEKLASATAAITYAPLATPTFTGTVTLPASTSIGDVSNLEIGYLNGVTSTLQGQIDAKAPLASPTFTGTVTLPANTITQSMMSDDSVGTAEIIASSVTSSELAIDSVTEAKIADGAVTSAKIANATIVNGDISASAEIATSKISGLDTALGLLAPIASPTFTGTVSGITKTMVGLGSADNTADTAKPVSTATQTALDLKSPLASPTFTGTVTTGHVLPATDVTFDLGSPAKMWRDIYVGPGSLYVNGQKVLQTDAGDVVVTADVNENLVMRTSGDGNIELDPTGSGSVTIKAPLVIQTGNNISNSDGNAVNFGGAIKTDTISSKTSNTDLSLSADGTGKVYLNDNAEVSGNLVVGGNLTVSGTTTTVNSETISLADNIIDLNSNFTTGTPTENAGIKIKRGDSSDVQIRWNESTDKWDFTNDGSVYSSIAGIESPTFTGTVSGITKTMVGLGSADNTADTAKPVSTATQTALDAKLASATAASTYAPIASPTFTGTVTVAASGVAFTDGTQTKAGIPSITTIGTEISAAYNLSTGGLGLRDQLIPIAGTRAITVPANSTTAYPIGTSIDWYQASGTGANFVADSGVTILRTPGLTLRTTYSSATLTKVATDTWLLAGDLTA